MQIECCIHWCTITHDNWFSTLQNLLQSETEGIDDEKIGFYGRCMHHTIEPRYLSIFDPIDEIGSQEEKEFTCARAEVFSSFIAFVGLYLLSGDVGNHLSFLFFLWNTYM